MSWTPKRYTSLPTPPPPPLLLLTCLCNSLSSLLLKPCCSTGLYSFISPYQLQQHPTNNNNNNNNIQSILFGLLRCRAILMLTFCDGSWHDVTNWAALWKPTASKQKHHGTTHTHTQHIHTTHHTRHTNFIACFVRAWNWSNIFFCCSW